MEKEKQYDALKQMKCNVYTLLQLGFGALACLFCFIWLCFPVGGGGDFAYFSGPFEFINIMDGYAVGRLVAQILFVLIFAASVVCFFVFGARSAKEQNKAFQYFLSHREEYENSEYLSANAKYYNAVLKDYLKVNSYFYEKNGKAVYLYKKLTGYMRAPLLVYFLLVVGCVAGSTYISAHDIPEKYMVFSFALVAAMCWAAFVFYYIIVKHRSRCFKRYAVTDNAQKISAGDYVFDEGFMEHISADEKLSARAIKMQNAGQKGLVAYIFSDRVTAILLGGAAIYMIVILFFVALVISIVSPSKGGASMVNANTSTARAAKTVIYGSGNDKYEIDGYGYILKYGQRTGFRLDGDDVLDERGDRVETVGWLRGNGTVDYANDYEGDKPFMRWGRE